MSVWRVVSSSLRVNMLKTLALACGELQLAWCRWSLCVCSAVARKRYLQKRHRISTLKDIDHEYQNFIVDYH